MQRTVATNLAGKWRNLGKNVAGVKHSADSRIQCVILEVEVGADRKLIGGTPTGDRQTAKILRFDGKALADGHLCTNTDQHILVGGRPRSMPYPPAA